MMCISAFNQMKTDVVFSLTVQMQHLQLFINILRNVNNRTRTVHLSIQ